MEYCIVEKGAKIGRNCIVSNLHIPTNAQIPDGSYLHTVPIRVDGATHFATFAFGNNCLHINGSQIFTSLCVDILDSMKMSVQAEEQSRLVYCGMGIVSYKMLYLELTALKFSDFEKRAFSYNLI